MGTLIVFNAENGVDGLDITTGNMPAVEAQGTVGNGGFLRLLLGSRYDRTGSATTSTRYRDRTATSGSISPTSSGAGVPRLPAGRSTSRLPSRPA